MRAGTIIGLVLALVGIALIGGGAVWMQQDIAGRQEALREQYKDMTFEEQFADSIVRAKSMQVDMTPEQQQAEYERIKRQMSGDDSPVPVTLQTSRSEEEAGLDLDTIVTVGVALGGLLVVLIIAGFLGIRAYLGSGDPELADGPGGHRRG